MKMKLTFWKNCFTIDDDEHSYEDPQSMKALAMLQSGHTPHAFLKLPPGTPIDMTIEYLREKNYTAERIRPFSGRAMRLGDYPSPAQGEKSDSPVLNRLELKGFSQNEPNGVVQLRLPNGSRISVNANTTQTLLELRQFVSGLPNIPLSFTILTGGRPPVHLSSLDDSKTLCETGILGSVLIVQE